MSEIDISGNISSQPLTFYNLEFNVDRTLDIDGKKIVFSRLTDPPTSQTLNWADLFDKMDWTSAIINNTQPTILRVQDTLRLVDLSGNNPRNLKWNDVDATSIDVSNNLNDNSNYFLNMSLTSGLNRVIYVNDASFNITYNPSLGRLNCQQFDGALHSQANNANQVNYLTYVSNSTNSFDMLHKHSSLTYNPHSGDLSTTRFIGDVSGNATSSTNASNVAIINADVNSTYYPVLASGTGNIGLTIDSVTTPLSYNPFSATLSVGNTTIATGAVTTATGTISTRLNLTNASSAATFASGTLTLNAGATRSFQSYTFTMSANITALTLTNLGLNGSFNLFITGHATNNYTIAEGGAGGLGAAILTSWATAETINANSRNLITIHYDNTGDKFYLRGTFGFTG